MFMDIMTNPVLLIAIPLLLAFISIFAKKLGKAMLIASVTLTTLLSFAVVFLGEIPIQYFIGGFSPPFGINLVVDGYSATSVIVLNVIFALIVLMSFKEIGKYAPVITVSLAALNGMILTGDLFNLFVFMEIAAVSAYILTTMNKGYKHTFNYLVLGTLGSGLYLIGIILLYNMFGSLNIYTIYSQLVNSNESVINFMTLPIVLIFSGLAVEAKLIPFGGWAKGVLKKANSLVGALIVSAFAFTILSVFGRLILILFAMNSAVYIAFMIVAIATLIFAEASAFSKKNLREILLFSSIAQSGLVIVFFLSKLYTPALMLLISNVLSKLVMFTVAGKFAKELKTDDIYELKGVFSKYVGLGIGFTVATLSLIGLPLFFGFIAKINALTSLFLSGNYWLPIIILLMAVIEGAYFIRILTNLWNAGEEGELASKDKLNKFKLDGCIKVGVVSLLVAVVLIGIGILPIINIKEFFAVGFMDFVRQLIGGM